MGPCLAKPAASAVSPEKPADASPAPANGDAPPKRQRRPSRTAIENNIDLNDEEQLDRVMMQIMEDPADLADFQAFALDKSSEEEIDLWTDIDEYVKQFAICDDDEGDTDEEKLTRRLEVERMLEKHFCDGGPATIIDTTAMSRPNIGLIHISSRLPYRRPVKREHGSPSPAELSRPARHFDSGATLSWNSRKSSTRALPCLASTKYSISVYSGRVKS